MFLVGKFIVKNAQNAIYRLNPKVEVHLPPDLPLPSTGMVKRMSTAVSRINALEPTVSQWPDEQLKAKTSEFKQKYQEAIKEKKAELVRLDEEYKKVLIPSSLMILISSLPKRKRN